jgi:hypothetical protein
MEVSMLIAPIVKGTERACQGVCQSEAFFDGRRTKAIPTTDTRERFRDHDFVAIFEAPPCARARNIHASRV